MTTLLGLDFTPLEEYETTEEQKLYAAMQAVGRVPNEDLPEICAMFGLLDIEREPLPEGTEYCRNNHPRLPENTRYYNGSTSPSCLICARNLRTGENR